MQARLKGVGILLPGSQRQHMHSGAQYASGLDKNQDLKRVLQLCPSDL